MQNITPFLWFDGNAEDAVNHYIRIFKNARVKDVLRCGDAGPGPKGSILTITFELEGQEFVALNGGPQYKFTPAISLMVHCETQAEVDHLWERLLEGGQSQACGWLTDKFGVSWQITPNVLLKMLADPDPVRSRNAMLAMMQMVKIDIAQLKQACDASKAD